MSEEESERA